MSKRPSFSVGWDDSGDTVHFVISDGNNAMETKITREELECMILYLARECPPDKAPEGETLH